MIFFVAFFANLCPLQRASSTNIAFQVNSDSTRTFGQAQSSSSDAVAEQLRQEIGSLRAKAAQVPCPSSHYSSFCIVFFEPVVGQNGSSISNKHPIAVWCYQAQQLKEKLAEVEARPVWCNVSGFAGLPGENGQMFQKLLSSIGISGRLKMLQQLPLLNSNGKKLKAWGSSLWRSGLLCYKIQMQIEVVRDGVVGDDGDDDEDGNDSDFL